MKDLKEKKKEVFEKINEIFKDSHEEDGLVGLSFKPYSAQVIGVDVENLNTSIAFMLVKNNDIKISTGSIYGTPVWSKNGQRLKNPNNAYLGIDFRSTKDIEVYYIDTDSISELTSSTKFNENSLYVVYWENEDYAQLFIGSYDFARNDLVRRIMTSYKKENREFLRHAAYELLFGSLPELKKQIIKGEDKETEEIEDDLV
jgi:hypothetical protein